MRGYVYTFVTFVNLENISVSLVFKKVDNLSEEESAHNKKIAKVQEGIEGKVKYFGNSNL